MQGTGLVEQMLDDAVTAAFVKIQDAVDAGDATPEQALDVMQTWGLADAWEEFLG